MTNKHKQQQQRRTSTMAGLQNPTTFPRLQRTISLEDEDEEQHQHFSTLHPILKRSKKEPILPTFEKEINKSVKKIR